MPSEPAPDQEPVKRKRPRSMLDRKTGRVKPDFNAKKQPKPKRYKLPVGKYPRITKKKKSKAEKEAKRHAADQADTERLRKRQKILNLREQGATIRQISEQMIANGETGCSPKSVFDHLVAALNDLTEKYTLNVKQFAQIRLNQMYRVELSHYKRLCDHDLSADNFEKLSRGMDRIWKRMDSFIDQLTGNTKQSAKFEIPVDAGSSVEAKIRVILPAAVEEDEPED